MNPDLKTTIGGVVLAIGQLLVLLPYPWAPIAGSAVSAVGAAFLGKQAAGVR